MINTGLSSSTATSVYIKHSVLPWPSVSVLWKAVFQGVGNLYDIEDPRTGQDLCINSCWALARGVMVMESRNHSCHPRTTFNQVNQPISNTFYSKYRKQPLYCKYRKHYILGNIYHCLEFYCQFQFWNLPKVTLLRTSCACLVISCFLLNVKVHLLYIANY